MSRKFWLAILIGLIGLPALADYVDVVPPDVHPNCLWQGSFKPVPGVNCPADWKVYPMTYFGTDTNLQHYSVVNGAMTYTYKAPVIPPAPPSADAAAMETAIMQDKNISDATKLLLTPYFPTITANQTNGALLGPLWTAIKNTGKLSPTEISLIEAYSNIYLVPLTGAQANGIRPRDVRRRIATPRQGNKVARVP